VNRVLTRLRVSLQASQPDELTIEEQEVLEVIDDGDMEDWVKVLGPRERSLTERRGTSRELCSTHTRKSLVGRYYLKENTTLKKNSTVKKNTTLNMNTTLKKNTVNMNSTLNKDTTVNKNYRKEEYYLKEK